MAYADDEVTAVIALLRTKAQLDHAARVRLDGRLDDEHRRIFVRAVYNVLSTELAVFTYAQIVDGLPTEEVAWDRQLPGIAGDHPIDEHEELCPGALEKAREYRLAWTPEVLAFDPKLVAAYQRAAPGTKPFETRLIELVAVSLHQFGTLLYRLDLRLHRGSDIESVTRWTMPVELPMEPPPPRPTLFSHHAYGYHDIYPEGVADMVGYWAEDRILGGVVALDRAAEKDSPAGEGAPSSLPNVWLFSNRSKVTIRACQLRDDQQRALVGFLLFSGDGGGVDPGDDSVRPPWSSPLPILPDRRNRVRVDFHLALSQHSIYRDPWERPPPTQDQVSYWGRRPKDALDYPETTDMLVRVNEMLGIPKPDKLKNMEGEKRAKNENGEKEGPETAPGPSQTM